MFKKSMALVLAVLLCMAFVGCGEPKTQDEEKPQNNISSETSVNPSTSDIQSDVEPEVNDNKTSCVSCGNQVESIYGFKYCDSCRCWTTTCGNQRTGSSSYCTEHKCLMCDNIKYDYSPYCYQHRCHKYGCDYPAISGEEYCTAHLN